MQKSFIMGREDLAEAGEARGANRSCVGMLKLGFPGDTHCGSDSGDRRGLRASGATEQVGAGHRFFLPEFSPAVPLWVT